jgi:hypothetical protein
MTDARVEHVPVDTLRARGFLAQAKQFLADGGGSTISSPSRQVLLHNAAIAACDALLMVHGRRVTPGDGGHWLRLKEAQDLLQDDHGDLFDRLDESRMARNDVSYRAEFVLDEEVDAARRAVEELLEIAQSYVQAKSSEADD